MSDRNVDHQGRWHSRSPDRKRRRYSNEGRSPSRDHYHSSAGRQRRSASPANERRKERDRGRDSRHHDDDHRGGAKSYRTSSDSRSLTHQRRELEDKANGPFKRSAGPLASQKDAFVNNLPSTAGEPPPPDKQKPNFGTSGRLAAESNTIKTGNQTIVLKYHEPPEARKPAAKDAWRMYVFKGDEIVETVELSEQSCWLFGRETAVADFPIEHPSCSKQHAVIQFRYVEKLNEFGDKKGKVKPYLLDLESANGTKINGEDVPAGRYVEVKSDDVLNFGHSTREYVVQLPPAG